jgi:sugar/nucleoside kinase (ribokinase family)
MAYDIVFIGEMGMGTIVPFDGTPFTDECSPVVFSASAASCLGKRVAAVTRVPGNRADLLDPFRASGVHVFARPGEIGQYRVVFATANVDERQPFLVKAGDSVTIGEVPPLGPCLVHLCCMGGQESQIELIYALKRRGFRLSLDMQGLVLQPDPETGAVVPGDFREKKKVLGMADFAKLDAVEARALTEKETTEEQAAMLEAWGSRETIITSSEGVFARGGRKSAFAKFSNRATRGRMGRGDTVMGSYLAYRLDHGIEESVEFAAAVASIKLESPGPFRGTKEEVMERMKARD